MRLLGALVCFLSFLQFAQAAPLQVSIVLSEDGGAYQAFSDSLRKKLPSEDFKVTVLRVDDPLGKPDLYVAVGIKAAAKLASSALPTLNVLVPKAGYDKLPHVGTHSIIFLDQPLERQVALLHAALPDTRQVGVLYSSLPPELPSVRHLLAEKNIRLHDRAVDDAHPLNDAMENLLAVSDALFVLPDADVYNAGTIRNLLLTAYRKQIPLVGISQAFVRAGALCAVFSSPEQYARQAANMMQRFAESGALPAPQYPSEFEVLVNTQVARSLDLHIKDAEQLRDEIRRNP